MSKRSHGEAWLECENGERFVLAGSNSIGRSSKNTIVRPGDKVSRRHALIQAQDQEEYWLVDLGSANGTKINERRVIQPTQLNDGDRVEIAGEVLRFQQLKTSMVGAVNPFQTQAATTARELRTGFCWLMVTDIKGFTELSRALSPDSLAQMVGGWLNVCNSVVQAHHGSINKYLGDGVLAYWAEHMGADALGALGELRTLAARGDPAFRTVLHYGCITIGGAAAGREESLLGAEMNYLFRIEKVAARLQLDCMLSEAAQQKLDLRENVEELPAQAVDGFDGMHRFYRITN